MNLETNESVIIGITVQKSRKVHVEATVFCTAFLAQGVRACHSSLGLMVIHTQEITVSNSMFINGTWFGMLIMKTQTLTLIKTTLAHTDSGLQMYRGINIKMEVVKLTFIRGTMGMHFTECNNTHITNVYASINSTRVLSFFTCTNISLQNTLVIAQLGLLILDSTHTYIRNLFI